LTSTKEQNEAIFESLRAQQDDIESNLGDELVWQQLPNNKACRISWSTQIDGQITELPADQRSKLLEWGVNKMDKFQEEFEPRVSAIELDRV
jgi:hypothetical protein